MNTRTGNMFENLRINLNISKRLKPATSPANPLDPDHEQNCSGDCVKDPTFINDPRRDIMRSSSSDSENCVSVRPKKRKCYTKSSSSVLSEKRHEKNDRVSLNIVKFTNTNSANLIVSETKKENDILVSSSPQNLDTANTNVTQILQNRSLENVNNVCKLDFGSAATASCFISASSSRLLKSSSSSSSSCSEYSVDGTKQNLYTEVNLSNEISHFEPQSSPIYKKICESRNKPQIEISCSSNSIYNSDDDTSNILLFSCVRENMLLRSKPEHQGKQFSKIIPYSSSDDSSGSDGENVTTLNSYHNNENELARTNISSENQAADCTKKRQRQKKAAPEKWIRNTAKRLRNSGKSHISRSSSIVPQKSLKSPCTEKCKLKCCLLITESQRKVIFDNYWEIGDLQRQREFVLRHISAIKPRYSYKVHNSNRSHNNAFYFTVNQQRIRICKLFFKATLDISDRTIKTVIQKSENANDSSVLFLDQRGKHDNHKSVDPIIKDGVREHINSIPRVESHYCRACTTREYIDGGKNIAELHRDYVKKQEQNNLPYANYHMYNHIFHEYNISFQQPKKDQCEDCASYANATENDKADLKDKFDAHLNEKMLARSEKDFDKKETPDNCIVCAYDLQATMPCPKGDVSTFYYLSKLDVYNFTICNIKNNDVSCYVWHEGDGKRGVIEIGTCVMNYIKNLEGKANQLGSKLDLIFYSDNCCGQHKNHFMIALYVYAVNHFEHINSITHKFLIKGHTQNEVDAAHSVIERQVRKSLKSGPIYSPDQYYHIIRNAKKTGKPYQVTEMSHSDFIDIKNISLSLGKNFTKDTRNNVLKLSDLKKIQVKYDDINKYSYSYKTSYLQENYKKVVIDTTKSNTRSSRCVNDIVLKQAYQQRVTVAEQKKKGLLGLIGKNIVPKFYSNFYESL